MPSRYGPPAFTQDETGPILADALRNAVGNFMQTRRQRRVDDQQQLDWKVTHPYIHEGALGPDGNPVPATASEGHEGALSSLAHHLMSVPSAIGGAARRAIGRGDDAAPMPQGATPPATHGGQSVQPVLSGVDPMRFMPPELTPSALPTGASPEATRFAHMLDPMVATAPRTRGLPPMVTTPTDGAHMLDPMVSRAEGTNPLAATGPQVTPSMGGSALAQQLLNVPGSRAPTGAGSGAPVTSADRPSDGRDLAATHPGAFDVATRQFGGSDLQLATAAAHTNGPASLPGPDAPAPAPAQAGQPGQPAPTGPMGQPQMPQLPQPTGPRYSAIDRTHYIDNWNTPTAEHARDREAQLRIASEAKLQQEAFAAMLRGELSREHDDRVADTQLGAPGAGGTRIGGTIAARAAARPPASGSYQRIQTADGRLWMVNSKNPTDIQPIIGPDGKHMSGTLPTVTVEDESGAAVVASRPDAIGHRTPAGRAGTGGALGVGAGGIGGVARQAGAIVGLGNADETMRPFEEAVRGGKADYSGFDYFLGQRAKMYDANGVIDQASHAAAFSHLDEVNPDLSNYLRAAEQWALEDSQLSGRASDFRVKMDGFISAIGPRAGKNQIDQVQKFRGTRLTELQKFQPAMESIASRMADQATGGGGKGAGARGGGKGGGGASAGTTHSAVSDADFKRAWAAGARSDNDIVTWVKSHPAGKP